MPGTTLTSNRASFDAQLGIDAFGAKDGGGNVVQQNGAVAQCKNIACRAVSS